VLSPPSCINIWERLLFDGKYGGFGSTPAIQVGALAGGSGPVPDGRPPIAMCREAALAEAAGG